MSRTRFKAQLAEEVVPIYPLYIGVIGEIQWRARWVRALTLSIWVNWWEGDTPGYITLLLDEQPGLSLWIPFEQIRKIERGEQTTSLPIPLPWYQTLEVGSMFIRPQREDDLVYWLISKQGHLTKRIHLYWRGSNWSHGMKYFQPFHLGKEMVTILHL